MLDAIETRLKEIPELKNRVYGATDLAAMKKKGDAPQHCPTQYVVELSRKPGELLRETGAQLQWVRYHIAVVTVIRKANDRYGKAANAELGQIQALTKTKLYGWKTGAEFDAFWLGPSGLLAFDAGVVWWQDEFITQKLEEATNG